mgnify:CR=1 FL=1
MTQFICKTYSDLSKDDVYEILKLRQEVFVVEQQCCYLDADSIDQYSRHLMILDDNVIVSYRVAFTCTDDGRNEIKDYNGTNKEVRLEISAFASENGYNSYSTSTL